MGDLSEATRKAESDLPNQGKSIPLKGSVTSKRAIIQRYMGKEEPVVVEDKHGIHPGKITDVNDTYFLVRGGNRKPVEIKYADARRILVPY